MFSENLGQVPVLGLALNNITLRLRIYDVFSGP